MTAEVKIECRFSDPTAKIEILSGLSWDRSSSVFILGLGFEAVFSLGVRPEDELWRWHA